MRQRHPGSAPRRHGQPGAVVGIGAVGRPGVGLAECGVRVAHRDAGRAGDRRWGRAGRRRTPADPYTWVRSAYSRERSFSIRSSWRRASVASPVSAASSSSSLCFSSSARVLAAAALRELGVAHPGYVFEGGGPGPAAGPRSRCPAAPVPCRRRRSCRRGPAGHRPRRARRRARPARRAAGRRPRRRPPGHGSAARSRCCTPRRPGSVRPTACGSAVRAPAARARPSPQRPAA